MKSDNLKRSLGFCMVLLVQLSQSSAPRNPQDFQYKVSMLLREEPANPKCFAEGRKDFTCFWEEDEATAGHVGQYSFTYAYQKENSSRCPLRTHRAADGKRLFICQLNNTQMFIQMDIKVERDSVMIHNRSLLVELAFLLDPPRNLSVSQTEQQGQLRVSWVPPEVKYMSDSMMYEVSYAPANGGLPQVEEVQARSEVVLRGLSPGTIYMVRARGKLDGISYNGYWSAWTQPVSMETPPAGFDVLIIFLVAIISVIVFLLSVTLIMSHRRFIKKKIWPAIPNPESKFQGLFTVYGGDFREWLGHTNGSLWLRPAFYSSEECPSPLEVLSELSLCSQLPTPPLPLKASRAGPVERQGEEKSSRKEEEASGGMGVWREPPHDHWLMEQLRAFNRLAVPSSQSSLLESQDAYVTLDAQQQASTEVEEHLDDIMEESSPLEVLFASSESRSDLGSMQRSSGSGRLSSGSSLEYPNQTWPPKGPGYTYMAVADSGVSMDYSAMSSGCVNVVRKTQVYNEYKNEIWSEPRPVLTRQSQVYNGW
ncbi:erythropoietin receptor [Gadus chalcogrammus]|uniref:erythropoietin receptor n=1 Tax=Gadus chalcogrammus TaxID=1042646 RepID=UPI0024C40455|nr:erythropoietin receptor [Gadus chalcogrammus]